MEDYVTIGSNDEIGSPLHETVTVSELRKMERSFERVSCFRRKDEWMDFSKKTLAMSERNQISLLSVNAPFKES